MEKTLIVSNLSALKELVKPGVSGDLFQVENAEDLANKIRKYISDSDEMNRLGKSVRDFVMKNYDWNIIIKKYISIYENLLN